ncbi:MAG: hypothetical protein AB8B93_10920 [Pseudomonadales bacterium]
MIRLRPMVRSIAIMLLLLNSGSAVAGQSWQFQKNRDPLGSGFVAVASTKVGINAGTLRPMVRCWTETASLDVRFTLAPEQSRPSVDRVLVAFDSKKPAAVDWSRNATRLALVVPVPLQRALLSKMRSGNELRLTLMGTDGAQHTHLVRLDGSARAIDQALASCTGS